MTVGTTFPVIEILMEKALVKPYWLVTTRITPSFPSENYSEITNDFYTAKKTISSLSAAKIRQSWAYNP